MLNKPDLVLVDDDQLLVNTLLKCAFYNKKVDTYLDPEELLKEVQKYSKDTRICLDNNFKGFDIKGVDLANNLHNMGFTDLYLLSGNDIETHEVPTYLKVVVKTDLDKIYKLCD